MSNKMKAISRRNPSRNGDQAAPRLVAVTTEQLFTMIGQQQVKIAMLEGLLAEARAKPVAEER